MKSAASSTGAEEAPACGRTGHLPRVGPVPEDGVAVRHNLGSRVLAVHAHPNDEDEEEDHFHLRHICCGLLTVTVPSLDEGFKDVDGDEVSR